MYKLYTSMRDKQVIGAIRSNEDGSMTSFLFVEGTSEYTAYLKWLEEGNTPEPADDQT